jgi:hypothetical protein
MFPASRTDTRDRLAGSASADGRHACADAVERAIAALGGDAGLVLFFTAGDVDPDAAASEAHNAAGDAHVAGMTGTGVIGTDGLMKTGCAAIAFSPSLEIGVGAESAGDARAAGREATAQALGALGGAPHAALLLFADSESGDQADFVAGAYDVAGGRIPFAGGAAGGAVRARFLDDRALSTGIAVVAIGSTTPIGVGIAHGCVPRGAPSIVTRSDGPRVLQLDGRPAEAVYLEKLGLDGDEVDDEDFDALAMVHALAEPELSGALRPRYVRGRAEDGALVCATTIERNAAVAVCDQTPETVVESARAAVGEALSQLAGPAEAAVVFDCAARSAWARDETLARHEFDALADAFGPPGPSLAGVYTRGEIGRTRGAKGDRNHSVVVTAFSAPTAD